MAELVDVPFQAWLWFVFVGVPATIANLAGFALLAGPLVQGAFSWTVEVRRLARGGPLPGLRIFAFLRTGLRRSHLARDLARGPADALGGSQRQLR